MLKILLKLLIMNLTLILGPLLTEDSETWKRIANRTQVLNILQSVAIFNSVEKKCISKYM